MFRIFISNFILFFLKILNDLKTDKVDIFQVDLEQRLVFVQVLEDRSQNKDDCSVHLPSIVWFNLNKNRKYISLKDCMIQVSFQIYFSNNL